MPCCMKNYFILFIFITFIKYFFLYLSEWGTITCSISPVRLTSLHTSCAPVSSHVSRSSLFRLSMSFLHLEAPNSWSCSHTVYCMWTAEQRGSDSCSIYSTSSGELFKIQHPSRSYRWRADKCTLLSLYC